jgi:endonuclease YncB( thermonuclease family)
MRFVLLLFSLCAYAGDFSGRVVAITDGDTIKVMHNGVAERIRLWGIDCPSHTRLSARVRSNSRVIWHSAKM